MLPDKTIAISFEEIKSPRYDSVEEDLKKQNDKQTKEFEIFSIKENEKIEDSAEIKLISIHLS